MGQLRTLAGRLAASSPDDTHPGRAKNGAGFTGKEKCQPNFRNKLLQSGNEDAEITKCIAIFMRLPSARWRRTTNGRQQQPIGCARNGRAE
jgi:hypothetical protein